MARKKNATFGGSKRGYAKERGKCVGDSYPADRFNNPVAAGIAVTYGDHDSKTVYSDTGGITFEGGGAPLNKGGYDKLWDGD